MERKEIEERLEKIKNILKEHNNMHLLEFYDDLSEEEKDSLLSQIEKIDFDLIESILNKKNYDKEMTENSEKREDEKITPMSYIDGAYLSQEEKEKYVALGIEAIKRGEYSFATLAGGQGTRLGHSGPKGTFVLDTNPKKSLFEIMCDRLKKAYEFYGVYIPWFIMTSEENNQDTVKFFEKENYFGYPKEKIFFFNQGKMPMVLDNGEVILEEKGKVKLAADGHGGIFKALNDNNILDYMKNNNIKWCFIGGIDNVLLNMVDPLLLGITISKNMLAASKTLPKRDPKEKVGIFCKKGNVPYVIEYSEISEEMANLRDEKGELIYAEGHILCNLFSVDALQMIKDKPLPYHIAHKKSNYIDKNGDEIVPETPNAYKFETFLFDAFMYLDDMLLLRGKREDDFAPIKNKDGEDSPATALKLYNDYFGTFGTVPFVS